MTIAFLNLGGSELLVFGVVAILVFGEKLPDAMRNLGKVYVKIRRGLTEASRPVREEMARIEREVHVHEHASPTARGAPSAPSAVPPYPAEATPPPASPPPLDEPPPV